VLHARRNKGSDADSSSGAQVSKRIAEAFLNEVGQGGRWGWNRRQIVLVRAKPPPNEA